MDIWTVGLVSLDVDLSADLSRCDADLPVSGTGLAHVRRSLDARARGCARELLDRRYARGEIKREEYLQMKKDLE